MLNASMKTVERVDARRIFALPQIKYSGAEDMNPGTSAKEMTMTKRQSSRIDRRAFVTSGLGVLGVAGLANRANAAEPTAAEKANIALVNEFCATWSGHNLEKVTSFFAEKSAYRVTEAFEPTKGLDAVKTRIGSFLDRVVRFEVLDTFARGPMVINERYDHFTNFQMTRWHGVGVFFVKDGKILEWSDYTIDQI
jgi:limonene-1,2-epoxide hydrolase